MDTPIIHLNDHNSNIYGELTCAPESGLLVAVISGSEGGYPQFIAERFSSSRHSVLSIAYFGLGSLPQHLEEIELRYFLRAIELGKKLSHAKKVVLVGNSRGGEGALLFASQFPDLVDGLIAIVPSCYAHGSFPYPNRPAWLMDGLPIKPFLGGFSQGDDINEIEDYTLLYDEKNEENDPLILSKLFLERNKKAEAEMQIQVENISCPVLLFSGGKDAIWPSSFYCERILSLRYKHCKDRIFTHIHFDNAGHGMAFPYFQEYDRPMLHPVGNFWCTTGGDPDANKIASEELILKSIQFINSIDSIAD